MSERGARAEILRLQFRATPALAMLSAILGLVFATHFLIARPAGGGAVSTVGAVLLFVLAGGELIAASALARLEPKAWTVSLATFVVATAASISVLLVESRALSVAYLLLNLAMVASIYRMRPLYTPESDERRRLQAVEGAAERTTPLERVLESDPDREVVLFVAFVMLAAVVTFYKGVKLYFQPDELSTTVGTVYVGFALLQVRACYGLWLEKEHGWILSMLLCLVATFTAAYHALVAEDLVSFAIVLFDALNVAQIYRLRERYVGEIAIGRPPE